MSECFKEEDRTDLYNDVYDVYWDDFEIVCEKQGFQVRVDNAINCVMNDFSCSRIMAKRRVLAYVAQGFDSFFTTLSSEDCDGATLGKVLGFYLKKDGCEIRPHRKKEVDEK